MSTSGSTDFSENARQIATSALEQCGVVPVGDAPEAAHVVKAVEQLNFMLKTWGASADPKLWLKTEGTVTLLASTASYSLANARKVLSVRRQTSSIDTPMIELARQDYYDLPTKASLGMPTSWYFDPQRATRSLYVWQVPDATIAANTTLQYTYLRVIEDVDSLADDIDLPQEWTETIMMSLAARLIIPFRRHIVDATGAALIQQRAAELYAQLSSWDEEDAPIFFQPAHR